MLPPVYIASESSFLYLTLIHQAFLPEPIFPPRAMVGTLNRNYAANPTASAKASKKKTAKTTESTTRRIAKVSVPKSKPLSARNSGMKKLA